MLTVILKLNHRKKGIQLLTFLLIFSLLISVGAACLRPQIVYASFAGTVAGYILTLFASFNTAITNPEVVTAINNTFGSMALEAADAGVIDQGISAIAANTGFDMAQIFSSTAAEATQVIEAAGITGTVAVAATAGENIAAGAGACAASATGAVLPAIGGLVLPAVGAVALGVAGGVLINHIRERIANFIRGGYEITTPEKIVERFPDGSQSIVSTNNKHKVFFYPINSRIAFYGNNYILLCLKYDGGGGSIGYQYDNSDGYDYLATFGYTPYENGRMYGNSAYSNFPYNSFPHYNDKASCLEYLRSFNKGLSVANQSPDLVGSLGNQKGEYDSTSGQYKTPGIRPAYEYGSNVVTYIPPSDYNDFVNDANENTDIGNTEQDPQGDLFDAFVNPFIKPIEDPSNPENPDNPDIPDPEQKPTVPYPDPEEYPDVIPEVNPVPDTDIAPTSIPYPELPDPTDEEITETNDKITPFDLKNKFPFCLPFDIHKALLKLKGARAAPYFVWQIPFGDAGQQTVTVDLSAWDDVASILRLLELLLFIVGLAVATRNLIGGT